MYVKHIIGSIELSIDVIQNMSFNVSSTDVYQKAFVVCVFHRCTSKKAFVLLRFHRCTSNNIGSHVLFIDVHKTIGFVVFSIDVPQKTQVVFCFSIDVSHRCTQYPRTHRPVWATQRT